MTIEEKYAQKLFKNISGWETRTLERIGKRLKATGKLSAYDQQAIKNIYNISGDMEAITRDLARVTGQNIIDVKSAFEDIMADTAAEYKPLYDFRGLPFVPFSENEYLQNLVKHFAAETAGEMINLSRTKGLAVAKYGLINGERKQIGSESLLNAYQSAIDKAVVNVTSGVGDFYSNMRDTIKAFGGSGVKMDYGNGVLRNIDAVIRQNLLFTVKEMQVEYDKKVTDELKLNGFEVNFSPVCRPSHSFMEGKMFSYNGEKTIDGVTYPDGAEALERMEDYNCYHRKMGVILGVSKPRYSKAEIEEKNRLTHEEIEYNGKTKSRYEWIQTQRKIERTVRSLRTTSRMAEAAGDTQLKNDCDLKVRIWKAKYNAMCEAVGITPHTERMIIS